MKRACVGLSAVSILLALLALSVSSLSALAESIHVFRRSGYNMVPLRYVADWLDGAVGYDAATGKLSLTRGDSELSLSVDSHTASVHGQPVVLPKTPMVLDGTTYIPASALRDFFGVGVKWDAKASAIALTKPWDEADSLVLPFISESFFLSDLQLDILNFRTDKARERIEQGANTLATDSNGMTAIHYAIVLWNLDVAQFLVKHNASIDASGQAGAAPLHFIIGRMSPYPELLSAAVGLASQAKAALATADSRKTVVAWLLDHGAKLEARRTDGRTPLLLAANVGATDIAELLLERGANIKAKSATGLTPLHEAAAFGNLSIAKLLLQRKADINARDDRGQTPLHLAVGQRQFEAVKWLIASGANVNARTTETDSQRATVWNDPLSGTRQYTIPCANVTPLHKAILGIQPTFTLNAQGGPASAAISYEIARYLISVGKADTTIRAFGGLTPLHYAADSLFVDGKLMQLLLENTPKSKVNLRTDAGSTALKMALRRKNTATAKLIEKFGGTE